MLIYLGYLELAVGILIFCYLCLFYLPYAHVDSFLANGTWGWAGPLWLAKSFALLVAGISVVFAPKWIALLSHLPAGVVLYLHANYYLACC